MTQAAVEPASENRHSGGPRGLTVGSSLQWLTCWAWLGPVLLALGLRLPLVMGTTYLSPDGAEYLDIARHLAAGEGYTLSIKAFHVDGSAVVSNGLIIRPPLYTLALAGLSFLPGFPRSAGVFNVVLVALNVGLIYSVARGFAPRSAALAAATATALAIPMSRFALSPLAEQLTLSLMLLALLCAIRVSCATALLAGLLVGLAYLSRAASLAVVPAIVLILLPQPGARRRLLYCAIGLGAVVAVSSVWSWLTVGRLFYGSQSFLYSVRTVGDTHRGFRPDEQLPGALPYIASHLDEVRDAVFENLWQYLATLLINAEWSVLALPAIVGLALALPRRRMPSMVAALLLLAWLNFGIAVGTWSTAERRYLLPTVVCLVMTGCWAWCVVPRGNAAIGIRSLRPCHLALLVAILLPGVQAFRSSFPSDEFVPFLGLAWVRRDAIQDQPELPRLIDWIETQTAPGEIVAFEYPWPITSFTRRPSTRLPRAMSPEELESFVRTLRTDYVVVYQGDPARRPYVSMLRKLDDRVPLPEIELGGYRVFKTSGFWR